MKTRRRGFLGAALAAAAGWLVWRPHGSPARPRTTYPDYPEMRAVLLQRPRLVMPAETVVTRDAGDPDEERDRERYEEDLRLSRGRHEHDSAKDAAHGDDP